MKNRIKLIISFLILCFCTGIAGADSIHDAVKKGDTASVKALIEKDSANLEKEDSEGRKPIHIAVIEDNADMVRLLLGQEAHINARDMSGSTPLKIAIRNKNKTMTLLLLENNAGLAKDEHGQTPLHWAAEEGMTKAVKMMVKKGVDINIVDNNGKTARQLAEEKGHKGITFFFYTKTRAFTNLVLVIAGIIIVLVLIRYALGFISSIHEAARKGNMKELKKILDKMPQMVNNHDGAGNTPLHWAASKGHEEAVSYFIKLGADVNARNKEGKTPLHLAAKNKQSKVEDLLLMHGAEE